MVNNSPITNLIRRRRHKRAVIDPKTLWATGEKGFLYDYTNWSTLFQDVNGEIPITAAGQPVGLALDVRFGYPPVRRNLLTATNTTVGSSTITTVDSNVMSSPVGINTADYLRDTAVSGEHYAEKQYSVLANTEYTYSFFVKGDGSGKKAYIRTALRGVAVATFNFTTGSIESVTASASAGSIPYSDGWYRIWLTYTSTTAGLAVFRPQILSGSTIYVGNGTGYYIDGQQLELNGLSQYQFIDASWAATNPGNHAVQSISTSRPLTAIDANGVQCITLDGVDDLFLASNLNLTTANTLTIFASIRKTSTTAGSIVGQTNSISFEGFWELGARTYASNDISLTVAGSTSNTVRNYLSFAPNTTQVITAQINGTANTMNDYFKVRANASVANPGATSTGPYSVSRFKNEAVTIGSRGSGSNRLGGNLYMVGIRTGLTDDVTLSKMEKYMNKYTKAY